MIYCEPFVTEKCSTDHMYFYLFLTIRVVLFPSVSGGCISLYVSDAFAVKMSTPQKSSAFHALRYKSNRRAVTHLEIENALQKAREAYLSSINSFMVVMRPSCVYRRFFMVIPCYQRTLILY